MAHSPNRITRKDIRRPDFFVTLTGKFFHLFTQYRTAFLTSAALLLAILLVFWGWQLYSSRQNRLANLEYSRALNLYHTGKYLQAIEALNILNGYSSSPYSRLGLLYQANSYLALQDSAKAVDSLRKLLGKETKDTFVRQLGLVRLAYIQEKAGQCKEAVEKFAEAEKISGPLKDDALLGLARCSRQNGDFKGALNSYRQYVSSYPASDKNVAVALRIQEIESMIGGAKIAK